MGCFLVHGMGCFFSPWDGLFFSPWDLNSNWAGFDKPGNPDIALVFLLLLCQLFNVMVAVLFMVLFLWSLRSLFTSILYLKKKPCI